MPKTKVELIENFLVVWDPAEGSELYKTAYYGKPVGIPKPKVPEFDVPLNFGFDGGSLPFGD